MNVRHHFCLALQLHLSVIKSIFKNVTAEKLFPLADNNQMGNNNVNANIDWVGSSCGIDFITSSVQNCDQVVVKNGIDSFALLYKFSEHKHNIIVFTAGYNC